MKIQVLSRSMSDHVASSSRGAAPIHKNLDPALHPFAQAREYTRALNAAKLERMFAKPFVGALESAGDGVYAMCKDYEHLGRVATGSADGMVEVWDLATRERVGEKGWENAHKGMVTGVCFAGIGEGRGVGMGWDGVHKKGKKRKRDQIEEPTVSDKAKGKRKEVEHSEDEDMEEEDFYKDLTERTSYRGSNRLLSCGVDKTVKLWDVNAGGGKDAKPLQIFHGKSGFHSITHHRSESVFATASDRIQIWDETKSVPLPFCTYTDAFLRSESIQTLQWSTATNFTAGDHIACVTFNQSETSVLACSGSDRTVILYDLRSSRALGRVALTMRVNSMAFNPMQPPIILFGSEDHQLYTFDMRKLTTSTHVYKDHIGAVMSCDWSPTGREFVSGSYDKTVRLWTAGSGRSRDCYHTNRMQRVYSTLSTLDARFLLTGSEDGNVRIWKWRSSEKLGVLDGKEKEAREVRYALRKKWRHVGEVKRIERQRYLPKNIKNQQKLRTTMLESRRKKEENRIRHTKKEIADTMRPKPERKRNIERVDT
ncbi:WD40 repeat-like protein [Atractiella rhizophila]|nr:WD40 repeat-like protein [Atractiella rhizophila]